MKVADIKLKWKKSPSADVSRVDVVVTNDGATTTAVVGPEVESYAIEVKARGVVSFKVVTYDAEGYEATSETYSFSLGDLDAPLPATQLGHEVIGVRDVPDAA